MKKGNIFLCFYTEILKNYHNFSEQYLSSLYKPSFLSKLVVKQEV